MNLLRRIKRKEIKAGVIGVGYVGLPLAVEYARGGYRVTGIDVDAPKVGKINRGESYIPDVTSRELRQLVSAGRLHATDRFDALSELDTINICVPTPLRKTKDPDLSFIVSAVEQVRNNLHTGQLVILESTTYPGTTEEIVLPLLQESGLRVGKDFWLAFSPERLDPGNREYTTRNIPKVVGGITPACAEMAAALYKGCIESVVCVSSTRVAEMVKLLENTFRSVNIGLVNEMTLLCHRLNIDVWEVIEAAKTKPFGFMAFYPGPGLGGHCLPVDPIYLSWKARMNGFEARFIELAGMTNSMMPRFVVEKVADALNTGGKSIRGSRIHALGVAYKKNTGDVRESPALDVLSLLHEKGANLSYSDRYIRRVSVGSLALKAIEPGPQVLRRSDCVVLLTDHDYFRKKDIVRYSRLILDTRNAFQGFKGLKVIKL